MSNIGDDHVVSYLAGTGYTYTRDQQEIQLHKSSYHMGSPQIKRNYHVKYIYRKGIEKCFTCSPIHCHTKQQASRNCYSRKFQPLRQKCLTCQHVVDHKVSFKTKISLNRVTGSS